MAKRVQVMRVTVKAAFKVDLTKPETVAKAAEAFEKLKTAANDLGFNIEDQAAAFGNADVEGE